MATQGISVFLPPVGVSLLVACSVGGVEPAEVARPLLPYLALMLALTLVIAFLPGVVLFSPTCSATEACESVERRPLASSPGGSRHRAGARNQRR